MPTTSTPKTFFCNEGDCQNVGFTRRRSLDRHRRNKHADTRLSADDIQLISNHVRRNPSADGKYCCPCGKSEVRAASGIDAHLKRHVNSVFVTAHVSIADGLRSGQAIDQVEMAKYKDCQNGPKNPVLAKVYVCTVAGCDTSFTEPGERDRHVRLKHTPSLSPAVVKALVQGAQSSNGRWHCLCGRSHEKSRGGIKLHILRSGDLKHVLRHRQLAFMLDPTLTQTELATPVPQSVGAAQTVAPAPIEAPGSPAGLSASPSLPVSPIVARNVDIPSVAQPVTPPRVSAPQGASAGSPFAVPSTRFPAVQSPVWPDMGESFELPPSPSAQLLDDDFSFGAGFRPTWSDGFASSFNDLSRSDPYQPAGTITTEFDYILDQVAAKVAPGK